MKKYNDLTESEFLKLLFCFVADAFLIAALCMPDRGYMLSGLWQIVSQPSKISTNYFAVGGYSATFLNMGLVAFACIALFQLLEAKVNQVSTLAFLLTLGFSSWGINLLNIWPTILGVGLYCECRKEKYSDYVNAMLFSTGIAPLITDLLVRYPHAEYTGFTPSGVLLAMGIGLAIGFFLPAGLVHAPKVHKGFDLYNAAVPIGTMAFFLQAVLYKTMGVALPAAPGADTLTVGSKFIVNLFCILLFSGCILGSLAMGCRFRDYARLVKDPEMAASFSAAYGNAAFLMNVGVYGLFILGYYNLTGVTFNGVTLGIIFCMLACCNSGSNPATVLPIMLGYVCASVVFGWLSGVAGGSFAGGVGAQAIAVGLCFANGLSPISRKYGWEYGFVAAVMHYLLVTSVPLLHGGYCLYNGGFTAAFICLLLIPILEMFAKLKEVPAAPVQEALPASAEEEIEITAEELQEAGEPAAEEAAEEVSEEAVEEAAEEAASEPAVEEPAEA